jgi:hypothetical protein
MNVVKATIKAHAIVLTASPDSSKPRAMYLPMKPRAPVTTFMAGGRLLLGGSTRQREIDVAADSQPEG